MGLLPGPSSFRRGGAMHETPLAHDPDRYCVHVLTRHPIVRSVRDWLHLRIDGEHERVWLADRRMNDPYPDRVLVEWKDVRGRWHMVAEFPAPKHGRQDR